MVLGLTCPWDPSDHHPGIRRLWSQGCSVRPRAQPLCVGMSLAEGGAEMLAFSFCLVLGRWAAELSRLQTRLGVKFVSVPSRKLPLSVEVTIRLSKNHSVRTHYF